MSTADQIEKSFSVCHRAIGSAWPSQLGSGAWLSDPGTDPEGIALAPTRDEEIDSGRVEPLSHEEFRRRIHGAGQ